MEHLARKVLLVCGAVGAVLLVGAALVWTGVQLYERTSAWLGARRAAQTVELWAVRVSPVRTNVIRQNGPAIDAGPFDSQSVCEAYTGLMNGYARYADAAQQYGVLLPPLTYIPGDSSWGSETGSRPEIVDMCRALRGVRWGPNYDAGGWPLGLSLEEARGTLNALLTAMRTCYTEWVQYDALPRNIPLMPPPGCHYHPPKSWADLPAY